MVGGMQNPRQFDINVRVNISFSAAYEKFSNSLVQSLNFTDGEKVMDYGCGTGTFFKKYLFDIAKEKKLKLVGVDISEIMIAFATKNSFLPGVTEYVIGNIMDSQKWPLADEKFDKIFASYVVHAVDNYRELFRKFYDCLTPGGTFSAVIPTSTIFQIFNEFENDSFWSTKYDCGGSKYFASWSWKDVQKGELHDFELAIIESGYQVVEFHHYSIPMEFEDIYEFLNFVITVNGPLSAIPKDSELYAKLQEDLIQSVQKCLKIDVTQKAFRCDSDNYWFTARKPI